MLTICATNNLPCLAQSYAIAAFHAIPPHVAALALAAIGTIAAIAICNFIAGE